MIASNTIDQSELQLTDPTNHCIKACTHSPWSFWSEVVYEFSRNVKIEDNNPTTITPSPVYKVSERNPHSIPLSADACGLQYTSVG